MIPNNNNLFQLLQLTRTDQVSSAEAELSRLAVQDPSFIDSLISILKSDNEFETKASAATYLNTAICDNHFNKSFAQYATFIANLLQDTAIEGAIKRLLERSIVSTIDQLQQPQITQLRELVFILIKDQILRDTAYFLIGCFCVPDSTDVQHIVYLTRNFMLATLSRIVLPNSATAMHLFKEYHQILKTWILAWDRLAKDDKVTSAHDKKSKKNKGSEEVGKVFEYTKLMMQICDSDQLCYTIAQIYQWFCQSPVYICTNQQLYDINLLKQSASQLHYRALVFTYKKEVSNKLLELTQNIIGNIFNNLVLAATNQAMLDKFECRDFVGNLLKVSRYYIGCKPESIAKSWKQILGKIVFPLMVYNEEELYTFQEAPSDFATLFEDCSQQQAFGIIKTDACKLLQKISDNSEKITQSQFITDFIINFCIDSIKNYFGVATQNPYQIDFVKFDVAITALCMFSYRLEGHKAKMREIKQIFNKQNVISLKPYDRTFMYLFLGYNYRETYENVQEGSFWIEIALQDKTHPTTQYCANDFLFNIADQYYSDFFVQALSNKLLTHSDGSIFDAMDKMVKCQAKFISPDLMLEVISKIYQRLDTELVTLQNTNVKETLIVIKLINIIGTLAAVKDYCAQYENVKNQIWKLVTILDKFRKFDLESEIYEILLALVSEEKQISIPSKGMLGKILSDYATDEYFHIYFCQIINHYITKSTFDVIPSILKTVNTGIMFHVFEKGEALKKSERKLILSHLLILLQNILAYHGNSLPENSIAQIGSICLYLIPQKQENIASPICLARALNVLFFCHMLIKTDSVIQYLVRFHNHQIYYNYDIRVFLACIKVEIEKENDAGVCTQLIIMATNMISGFRKREKMDASAKMIKAKYGKDNRLKLNKYKEFEKFIKLIETPFKSEKRLQEILKQIIQSSREKNPQKFKLIYTSFSEAQKKQISTISEIPENELGGKRALYTILKPKAPQNIRIEENDEIKNSSDQQTEFKRKRQEMKKLKKNKEKKKGKGDEDEMQ